MACTHVIPRCLGKKNLLLLFSCGMHATPPHSPPPVFVSPFFPKKSKRSRPPTTQQPPTTNNFPSNKKPGPNNRRIDILSVFFFFREKTIFTPSRIKIPQLIEPPGKTCATFSFFCFLLPGGRSYSQITSSPNNENEIGTKFG
jgi:hypothetical protein